jgi:hypothetical protein
VYKVVKFSVVTGHQRSHLTNEQADTMLRVPVYKCSTGMDYTIRLPQGTGYKRGYNE